MKSTRLINWMTVFAILTGLMLLALQHWPDLPKRLLAGAKSNVATQEDNDALPELDEALRGSTFYCSGDNVRVRYTPDLDDETNIVPDYRLMLGDTVQLLGKSKAQFQFNNLKGNWYNIQTEALVSAWVFYYLQPELPLPAPPMLQRAGVDNRVPNSGISGAYDKVKLKYEENFGDADERALAALVKACDVDHEKVRNTAVNEAVKNKSEGAFNLGQVCNLYEFAVKDWHYVNDPAAFEYVAKASESIDNRKAGDCDDYAVLAFSLVSAVGGECRVNYAAQGSAGHAFSEICLGPDPDFESIKRYISIRFHCAQSNITGFRRDAEGQWWMNLDWTGIPKHPGGPYFNWDRCVCFDINKRKFQKL